MVKEPVRRDTSSGAAKKSGGALSRLFAEENEFDRRALLRIGSWGATAVGAVTLAVMANQSSLNLRRDQSAAAELTRQAQQIQLLTRESQNETRRLASAIDTLNSDRDRLFSRVTILEEGLDSMTGALARQSAALANPSVATASAPSTRPTDAPLASQNQPAPAQVAVVPQVDPVSTTDAFIAARPRMDLPKGEPAPAPGPAEAQAPAPTPAQAGVQSPPPAPTPAAVAPPPVARQAALTPQPAPAPLPANPALVAAKSMIGPPDAAAPKPVEPAKPASVTSPTQAPASAPAPEPAPPAAAAKRTAHPKVSAVVSGARDRMDLLPKDLTPPKEAIVAEDSDGPDTTSPGVAVRRTEFAVDLGSANSVGGLRALWRGLSKSNTQLAALSPIIVVKESNTGLGMQLHLAAGPLGDAATAARICATVTGGDHSCETTVFDGQRLAMQADETSSVSVPPAAGPKAPPPPKTYYGRRYPPKHLAKKEEPPPPPPPAPAPPAAKPAEMAPSSTSGFSSLFKR